MFADRTIQGGLCLRLVAYWIACQATMAGTLIAMAVLRLVPVFFSALLLAAHFLRMESIPLVVLVVLIPLALFVKRPWAARLVQLALILGALEWVRTLLNLIGEREAEGEPWTRLAVILGLVALFTVSAALPFWFSRPVRARYGLGGSQPENQSL